MMWPKDRLTRFEVARLLSARALQISLGAPLLIKPPKGKWDPMELARLEFKAGLIPMTVKRRLPTGEEVIVDVKTAIKRWLEEHGGEI